MRGYRCRGLESNARFNKLLLDPFVAIEINLDCKRSITAYFDKRRTEVLVHKIKIVVIDAGRLSAVVEADVTGTGILVPGGLESTRFLSGDTDKVDALAASEILSMLGGDIVLALITLEMNNFKPELVGGRFTDFLNPSVIRPISAGEGIFAPCCSMRNLASWPPIWRSAI